MQRARGIRWLTAGAGELFASVTALDRAAADALERVELGWDDAPSGGHDEGDRPIEVRVI